MTVISDISQTWPDAIVDVRAIDLVGPTPPSWAAPRS
jgi:hypothetical protein